METGIAVQRTGGTSGLQVLFVVLLVIASTIGLTTDTGIDVTLIDGFRYVVLGVLVLIVLMLLMNVAMALSVNKRFLVGVSIALLLTVYSVALSIIFGGDFYFFENPMLVVYVVVCILVAAGLCYMDLDVAFDYRLTKWLSTYFVMLCIGLVLGGGIDLAVPPRFKLAEGIIYSQGLSYLFGMASITLLCLCGHRSRIGAGAIQVSLLFLLSIIFLFFSMSGAGRAGFLGAGLVWGGVLLWLSRKVFIGVVVAVVAIAGVFINELLMRFSDLTIVSRLLVFGEGDYGLRDKLIIESFQLLADKPLCLLVGCGANFFQVHYGYVYGFYPHNFMLEYLITFGFPIAVVSFIFFVRGVFRTYTRAGLRLFLSISLYSLIVSLAIGSIYSFISFGALVYFMAVGLQSNGGNTLGKVAHS